MKNASTKDVSELVLTIEESVRFANLKIGGQEIQSGMLIKQRKQMQKEEKNILEYLLKILLSSASIQIILNSKEYIGTQ